MRLSCIILVAVISSVKTASGEMSPNQPQLPADTALWGESGGVTGKRSLRTPADTYDDKLEGTGDDAEERRLEFLKKFKLGKWVEAQKANYKIRRAEKLAAIKKHNEDAFDTLNHLMADYFSVWNKLGYTDDKAKAHLKEDGLEEKYFEAVLSAWKTCVKE
ncbi:hypothetical protein PF011_g23122 [Phytophthora fragariae]|uniref:RxLR effector protein n=1 Tax=Phytophthora fragariae TaxID=53985 RepID=A0A6A3I7C6_9STRA|nr:hypothetical protein PF011_g23122 [Phytophthora fragariae]